MFSLTFSSAIFFLRKTSNFFLESPSQVAPMLQTTENRNQGSISFSMAASFFSETLFPC